MLATNRFPQYKQLFTLILLIGGGLILPIVQGCKEKPRHEAIYQRVRPLLDSIPEEALSILDSIPKKDLQPGLDSARYILLHAIAENKAYKFTTKDSTITLAIETFRTYNQIDDLRNSLFIQGWIRILDQQYIAAIRPLLEAEELIDNRTPELEKGLIYHALADCCNFTSNGLMAIEYSRKAYSAYVNANKPLHALYNISDRAAYFNNMGDYRNAHKLLLSMLDSAKNTFNDDLIGWYYDGLGRSCIGLQNYDEALKYFQNLKEVKDTLDDMTEGLLVYAMTKAGNKSTADSIARKLVADDNFWAIKGITPITSSEDMLVDISARQENQMADVLNSTYANEYSSIIKENYTLRRNLMVTELKAKRLLNVLLTILILITLLIASIGIYKFRQYAILQKKATEKERKKAQRLQAIAEKEKENAQQQSEMMKQTLQDLKNLQQRYDQETDKLIVENECSRYKIREIHEGYVTAVNKLGGICYTTTLPKPNIDKKSITWLDNLMKSLGQPEQQQKLTAIINTLHDDIIVQLKNNAPELTETDLQLYILLLSGFSPIIISKITGIKHIGVKKFRLIEKLLNHKPNSLSHYVNF